MAWDLSHQVANAKPLFLITYTTMLIGLVSSVVYVGYFIYTGKRVSAGVWSSPPPLANYSRGSSQASGEIASPGHMVVDDPVLSSKDNFLSRPIWEAPPVGTKMPSAKAFSLNKRMVEYRAKDNVIVVTFGNFAFMDFIVTWTRHLTEMNVVNLLVGAMDTKLLEALFWKGIPVFDMGSNMNPHDAGWGSPVFHKMGREKVILIDALLPFGYELLMCDTDMVWLKNPLPYFARFTEADVLVSSDQVVPTVVDDKLEVWQQVTGAYNIGIFHWRPTVSSRKLVQEWKDMLLADKLIWDQNGFNELMHRSLGPSVDEETGLVYAFDGSLKLGILPASIFCSGHTYFIQAMHQQLRLVPYAVHTTFQYGGTEGKRHRLREAMLFFDQPEYYDSPGGFLSFKPNIPKVLLLDGNHTIDSHFSLINYQLKRVRTAFAIASLLNRTLVMPPLWCRLDRLWFGHPGILPGTMTRQPFICPLDHIFQVDVMFQKLPEAEFGRGIDFREYSFLENPLLPSWVRDSDMEVQLCDKKSINCIANGTTPTKGVVRFMKNGSEEMFLSVFSMYKDVKLLKFSSMEDAFQGFTDKMRETKFRNRMKRYMGIWCCVENRDRGHIYYDMYWDEKPSWKPTPPATVNDDHPPW